MSDEKNITAVQFVATPFLDYCDAVEDAVNRLMRSNGNRDVLEQLQNSFYRGAINITLGMSYNKSLSLFNNAGVLHLYQPYMIAIRKQLDKMFSIRYELVNKSHYTRLSKTIKRFRNAIEQQQPTKN